MKLTLMNANIHRVLTEAHAVNYKLTNTGEKPATAFGSALTKRT